MEDFARKRKELIAQLEPGPAAARALCDLTDAMVRRLASEAADLLGDRWAIVALGGWGAGSLLPASDLDILVLSDAPAGRLKPFVESVLYPLWDVGLKVGHQVRSPKQQLKAMRDDLATCTAALTARPLAGDIDWAKESIANWAHDSAKRSKHVVRLLEQRPRPGSPYLLEPDLKHGAGGRRDYDELVWTATVLAGTPRPALGVLAESGLLQTEDVELAQDCANIIATARWELQATGASDRLTLDLAHDLAAVDPQDIQRAMAQTARVLTLLRDALAGKQPRREDMTPHEVFSALSRGEDSLPELEIAAQGGRLDALLPGFEELMTRRRPGLGHELTVGAHSLKVAALVADGTRLEGALARSLSVVDRVHPVQVAALAHDVGKMTPGPDHAERGAEQAGDAARRFGLSEDDAVAVKKLVANHLLLSETALHEDLDDEDVLLHCASVVGDASLLAQLHLLTAADAKGTGSSTWTTWTAVLIDTLVARLQTALDSEVDGAGLAARGEASRARALGLMADDSPERLSFVRQASLRYLAAREPEQIREHARLVAELAQSTKPGAALVEVSGGPGPGMHVVTVAAHDQPELLARLTGAVALAGLDILGLDAYATPGRVVLDTFVVTSATARPASTDTFVRLERLIEAALLDRLELEVRLEERRRHYRQRATADVEVDLVPSGWFTKLTVIGPDRPGLLYDVARSVSASGLDIKWAKAQTVEGVARDVFHLVDLGGVSVTDPGTLGHIAMRIRESL